MRVCKLLLSTRGLFLVTSTFWLAASTVIGQARWIAVLFASAVLVVMDTCGNTTTYEGVEVLDRVEDDVIFLSLFFAIPGLLWWLAAFSPRNAHSRLRATFYLFSGLCAAFGAISHVPWEVDPYADYSGLWGNWALLAWGGGAGAFGMGTVAGLVLRARSFPAVFGLLFLLCYQALLGIATPLASWMMKAPDLSPILIFFAAETGVLLGTGLLWLWTARRARRRKALHAVEPSKETR